MDLKKLTDKAKDLVEKRGGTESLKEDAGELKGIAKGEGSFSDKAKAAVAAIKDPGDEDTARPAPAADRHRPPRRRIRSPSAQRRRARGSIAASAARVATGAAVRAAVATAEETAAARSNLTPEPL